MSYLKLVNPCSERWNKMQPTEKGRFCGNCQKQVIDFSQMDIVEISKIIHNQKNICAQITSSQLDEPLINFSERKSIDLPVKQIAAGLMIAASLAMNEASAQNSFPHSLVLIDRSQTDYSLQKCYLSVPIQPEAVKPVSYSHITGTIKIKDSLEPIVHVKIRLVTLGKIFNTFTDENGNFELKVPDALIFEDNVLVFDYNDITNKLKAYDYIKNRTLIYGKQNLLNEIKIEIAPEPLEIRLGGISISSYFDESKPLVFLDGNKIKYKVFVEALQRNERAKINLAGKEYIFFNSFYARAILGEKAPDGFYLIFTNEK